MSRLQNITVTQIDTAEQQVTPNVRALLSELSTKLSDYLSSGKSNSIDLKSLPLLPGEYEAIKSILGQGEVKATLSSLGTSNICETIYPGIWWITHNNEDDTLIAESIEVTALPDILQSQQADIEQAQFDLQKRLQDLA